MFYFTSSPVWSFKTDRFTVELFVTEEVGYRYDGDDPEGEVQDKLDSGEYVAFDSEVRVSLDGKEIAADYLGGSVYALDEVPDFWEAHRSPDFMNRNCSLRRAIQPGSTIGHYFPDMVATAIGEARDAMRRQPAKPYLRATA